MPGLAATLAGRLPVRLASPLTRDKGVGAPEYMVIDGTLGRLLVREDGTPLMRAAGTYLYRRIA